MYRVYLNGRKVSEAQSFVAACKDADKAKASCNRHASSYVIRADRRYDVRYAA